MSRLDVVNAVIAKKDKAIAKLKAVKNPSAKQAAALATDIASRAKYVAERDALLAKTTAPAAPASAGTPPVRPANPFAVPADSAVSIEGGTAAGNPNGVTYTNADAIRWWEHVWLNNVGYHKVRSTLLPGSHVLSPEGLAYAQAFEKQAGLVEAPENYNPLSLPIVP